MRLGKGTSQVARSLRPTGKAHPATGDQGQQTEPDEGLIQAFYRWREKCVNLNMTVSGISSNHIRTECQSPVFFFEVIYATRSSLFSNVSRPDKTVVCYRECRRVPVSGTPC